MMTLTSEERKPTSGKFPKQLIIFLHGLGADGKDLIDLAAEFAPEFPDAQFLSPNAPYPCDMAPYGYQWFSLQERTESNILSGIRTAAPILDHYLDNMLEKYKLADKDMAIIGFSQGTMMALYTMPRRKSPCAALVGYSGALVAPQLLAKEAISKPKILLVHGDADQVVPVSSLDIAVNALQSQHFSVQSHISRGLGHGIDQHGVRLAKQLLKEAFIKTIAL